MQPDLLAERDRARRARQMRRARLQLILLLAASIVGTVIALLAARQKGDPAPADPTPATAPEPSRSPFEPPRTIPASVPHTQRPALPESPSRVVPPSVKTTPAPTPTTPADATPKPAAKASEVLSNIGVSGKQAGGALPRITEARDVLARLAAAKSVAERLPLLIEKTGLEERLREYYDARRGTDPVLGEKETDYEEQTQGARLLMVRHRREMAPGGVLLLAFQRDAAGAVRLDWESFTGWSAMSWKQFREQRPAGPRVFRALVSPDDYHNYEFTDAQKHLSTRLRGIDGTDGVNAYCDLGSDLARELAVKLAAAPRNGDSQRAWLPLTVRVEFPKDAQSDHCVHLHAIIQDGWLNLRSEIIE